MKLIRIIAWLLGPLDRHLYRNNPYPETWVQHSKEYHA